MTILETLYQNGQCIMRFVFLFSISGGFVGLSTIHESCTCIDFVFVK